MKTNTRKQTLKKFREVKVQLHISVTLDLRSNQKDFRIEKVIDLKRFSNFYKLHGITTYVLRFKENCRNKFWQESPEIAAKEINEARLFWVKQIQTLLVANCKFEKTKTNLGIFADEEEIYRCVGDKTRQVYHLNANILP